MHLVTDGVSVNSVLAEMLILLNIKIEIWSDSVTLELVVVAFGARGAHQRSRIDSGDLCSSMGANFIQPISAK